MLSSTLRTFWLVNIPLLFLFQSSRVRSIWISRRQYYCWCNKHVFGKSCWRCEKHSARAICTKGNLTINGFQQWWEGTSKTTRFEVLIAGSGMTFLTCFLFIYLFFILFSLFCFCRKCLIILIESKQDYWIFLPLR